METPFEFEQVTIGPVQQPLPLAGRRPDRERVGPSIDLANRTQEVGPARSVQVQVPQSAAVGLDVREFIIEAVYLSVAEAALTGDFKKVVAFPEVGPFLSLWELDDAGNLPAIDPETGQRFFRVGYPHRNVPISRFRGPLLEDFFDGEDPDAAVWQAKRFGSWASVQIEGVGGVIYRLWRGDGADWGDPIAPNQVCGVEGTGP